MLRERRLRLAVVAGTTAALVAVAAASATGATANTLYVSSAGSNANPCTSAKPCKTLGRAVGKARKGNTVLVRKGTYRELVMITKGIRVAGVGRPVVAANGLDEGFFVAGRQSAGAVVSGFVVRGANFEGILVETTSRVTISNNAVQGNDQGRKAQKPVGECAPMGQVPGDCGEGVHLMSVTNSRVVGNQVNRNSGGILLTDELGPTAHNLISGNDVSHNPLDCGVTIAGHNSQALGHPKTAGVYGNTIINNVANDVGTKGEGAGILIAAAVPGAAAYDNLVKNNVANDDGLAGVTLHSHTPAQDLNGNVIINNRLKHDGLDAGSEAEFGENGKTVGILVGSGVTKLKGIVIAGNTIQNVHFGIYTKNAPKVNPRANTFKNVKVRIKQV